MQTEKCTLVTNRAKLACVGVGAYIHAYTHRHTQDYLNKY